MKILNSIPKVYNWTDTAVDCYERGCICKDCPIIRGLETVTGDNCMVKNSVLKLVKKFGRPQRGINYRTDIK